MILIIRGFLWLVAVALILGGAMFLVNFETITSQLALPALTGHARNTVSADIGAGIFSFGFLIFLYLINGRRWLWPAIIVTAVIPVLRYVSFISDGWIEAAIPALVLEGITLIALLLMAFVYDRNENIGTDLFDGLNSKTLLFLHHWVAYIAILAGLSEIFGALLAPRQTSDPSMALPAMIYGTLYLGLGVLMWLRKSQLAAGLILLLQIVGFLGLSFMFHQSIVPVAVDKFLLVIGITNISILLTLFTHISIWDEALNK